MSAAPKVAQKPWEGTQVSNLLTFQFFQRVNATRCEEAFPTCEDWPPEVWALAIAGEVGELCNLMKKVRRGDFDLSEKRDEILDEIADVITYCDLLISKLGASTPDVLAAKFNEVSKRVDWKGTVVPR